MIVLFELLCFVSIQSSKSKYSLYSIVDVIRNDVFGLRNGLSPSMGRFGTLFWPKARLDTSPSLMCKLIITNDIFDVFYQYS
ncbi:hypothetical protein ABFS83_04G217400 [Erythranthe nasuta]